MQNSNIQESMTNIMGNPQVFNDMFNLRQNMTTQSMNNTMHNNAKYKKQSNAKQRFPKQCKALKSKPKHCKANQSIANQLH